MPDTRATVVNKQQNSQSKKSIKKSPLIRKKATNFEEDLVYYVSTQDEREVLSSLIDFQPSSFNTYFD